MMPNLPAAHTIVPLQSQAYANDFMDLTDLELFDAQFESIDPNMQQMVSTTTQGFWMDFPGDTEMY
jgi:hypothetical protein